MTKDKKSAHPTAATVERARLDAEAWQATASNSKFITVSPPGQSIKIADFLSKGESHAVPLRHLRELLHLPARTVRLMIRAERLAGTPILESSKADGGYFMPENDHERDLCARRLRHRAAQIIAVADAIERAGADFGE